jgi:hypothetical protein
MSKNVFGTADSRQVEQDPKMAGITALILVQNTVSIDKHHLRPKLGPIFSKSPEKFKSRR